MTPSAFARSLLSGTHPRAALTSLVLLPLLFLLDRYLPMGVAAGVLYAVPVLLTQYSLPGLTLIVSILSSLLILADVLLSSPDTVTWMVLLNRVFALLIVWSIAVLVRMRQRAEQRVLAAQASLGQKVAERTAHLEELNRRLCAEMDERARIEQSLRESEQKYHAMLDNAVDAILLADLDGRLTDANRRAEALLGYSRDELVRMHALDLHPKEEHPRVIEVFQELAKSGSTLVEHPVLRKDGTVLRVEVAATVIRYGGQSVAQGIFRDVTERRQQEAQRLEQEKQHRDALVREVHHRIKNNLQGVVGLLREHASTHPELVDVISAAIGQVQSISVVYGLHGKGDDLQVRLCDMVQAIARSASTLTRTAVQPDVQLAIDRPVKIDTDEAVPVALIVNELILNAVKHSRGDGGEGRVVVRVTQTDHTAEVCVMNPGSFPDGFDFAQSRGSGTGLGLVRSLLPHAGAELTLEQVSGEIHARLRLSPPVVSM